MEEWREAGLLCPSRVVVKPLVFPLLFLFSNLEQSATSGGSSRPFDVFSVSGSARVIIGKSRNRDRNRDGTRRRRKRKTKSETGLGLCSWGRVATLQSHGFGFHPLPTPTASTRHLSLYPLLNCFSYPFLTYQTTTIFFLPNYINNYKTFLRLHTRLMCFLNNKSCIFNH